MKANQETGFSGVHAEHTQEFELIAGQNACLVVIT